MIFLKSLIIHVFESFLEIFSPKKVLFRRGSKIFSCQNVSDDIVYTTIYYQFYTTATFSVWEVGFLRAVLFGRFFGGGGQAAAVFLGRFFGRAGLDGCTCGGLPRAVFGAARDLAKS